MILAGSSFRKYISEGNSSVPVRVVISCLMASIFWQNTTPTMTPTSVPITPIDAPVMKNIRRIAPRFMPIVRKIAISRLLSLTNITRPETMFSEATSKIIVRIRNITLRSTFSAPESAALVCCQSLTQPASSTAWSIAGRKS